MPLKVSDGMGAWVDDFKKSDAPQFKGKSGKERRDMAIAAYLSAKRGGKPQSESVTSADKKPEKYMGPDGKPKIRMVPVDKEIVKTEAKRVVHSDRPDSLKSVRVMHPKPASEKPPFEGPYRKAGEVKKDKFGNVVKNRAKHLARMAAKTSGNVEESVSEETNFQVNIEGLPMMFMSGMGPGEIKQKLRKIVKQPSMIQSVKRVTDADVKKTFRLKAQGRDDEEEQVDEALKHTHAVIDGNGKVAGMSSDEKGAKDIARRHNGRVVKLKKPISSRKGDMMINRPFSEAKLDELSPALLKRYDDASAKKHAMPDGGSTYKDTRTARNRAIGSIRSLKRQAGLKGKTDKVSRADHMKAFRTSK